ncbi:MAG: asparagine synthase-related protein [Gemmataceae bacterium]
MDVVSDLDAPLAVKRDRLLDVLRSLRRVIVALSGGIDSTLVAKAAHLALGADASAITADSASVPRAEIDLARDIARSIGISHRVVQTDEFSDPDYVKNDGARCYFCKSELYTRIEGLLPEIGDAVVCSGANLDDQGDYRPGLKAAAEHRVRHPLQEAGFTKSDVRPLPATGLVELGQTRRPLSSSRLAPGVTVTPERTSRVEERRSTCTS